MPKPFDLLGPVSRSSSVAPEDMLMLKRALRTIGRYPDDGDLTPYPDDALFEGVAALQEEFGLAPTGTMRPGDATVQALAAKLEGRDRPERPTDFLLVGSVGDGQENRSEDVIATQRALAGLGSLPRTFDLSPGPTLSPSVVEGIRSFQRNNGLAIDGRIEPGGETEALLDSLLRLAAAPPPEQEPTRVAESAGLREMFPDRTPEKQPATNLEKRQASRHGTRQIDLDAELRAAGVDDAAREKFADMTGLRLGTPEGTSVPLYAHGLKVASLSGQQAAVFVTQMDELRPKLELFRAIISGDGAIDDLLRKIEILRPRSRGRSHTDGPYEQAYHAARRVALAIHGARAEGAEPNLEVLAAALVPALFRETDQGKYRLVHTVLPALVEMAPLTGNVISAVEAAKGFGRLWKAAVEDGDMEAAVREAALFGLNTAGALSGLGIPKAAIQGMLKAAGKRSEWARKVGGNMAIGDAVRYAEMPLNEIRDVKHETLRRILSESLPVWIDPKDGRIINIVKDIVGRSAENQVRREINNMGAPKNYSRFTPKGNTKITRAIVDGEMRGRFYDDDIVQELERSGWFVTLKKKGPNGKIGVEIKSSRAEVPPHQSRFDDAAIQQGQVDAVQLLREPIHLISRKDLRKLTVSVLVHQKRLGPSNPFTVEDANKIADRFYLEGRKMHGIVLIGDYLRGIALLGAAAVADAGDDVRVPRPPKPAPSLLEPPETGLYTKHPSRVVTP